VIHCQVLQPLDPTKAERKKERERMGVSKKEKKEKKQVQELGGEREKRKREKENKRKREKEKKRKTEDDLCVGYLVSGASKYDNEIFSYKSAVNSGSMEET
jgi:vacuolar-type H+-ATPase subunit I/STV1